MRAFLLYAPIALVALASSFAVWAQNDQCDGGAVKTHDAYLYGRFETRMQSTLGSGSMKLGPRLQLAAENNEIDIEMTERTKPASPKSNNPRSTTPSSGNPTSCGRHCIHPPICDMEHPMMRR